jgi:hypothetical protein
MRILIMRREHGHLHHTDTMFSLMMSSVRPRGARLIREHVRRERVRHFAQSAGVSISDAGERMLQY